MWFVTRRRHEQELAAAREEIARLRRRVLDTQDRHDEVVRAHNKLAEELAATSIVNDCLTTDLTTARERLAEYGSRRTVSEVLVEHDAHRKALAEAIRAGLHLNWEQLIETARQTFEGATEWRADCEAEKRRADQLQERLDDACGLGPGGIEDSGRWQPGYKPKPGGVS